MKIYFSASMSGLSDYEENYKEIVRLMESMGHEVISDHILGTSVDGIKHESLDERAGHYKRVKRWIAQSDVVVVESSHASTNVGYEISMALERERPVLCLHTKGRVPVLLIGVNVDKLRVVEYSMVDIKKLLRMYVEELGEQVDTRFNFFISPKISNYLDWIAKNKRTPRAVYLRRLIENDMSDSKFEE